MSLQSLLEQYESDPAELQRLVADVTAAESRMHPIADTWSILEVVCHLADFEVVYSDRMKRVLAEDNPTLSAARPEDFTAALHYDKRSLAEELDVIAAVRKQTARILRSIDLEEFQRTGVHSEDGPLTLETLLEGIVSHIPHHLAFVRAKISAIRETK